MGMGCVCDMLARLPETMAVGSKLERYLLTELPLELEVQEGKGNSRQVHYSQLKFLSDKEPPRIYRNLNEFESSCSLSTCEFTDTLTSLVTLLAI